MVERRFAPVEVSAERIQMRGVDFCLPGITRICEARAVSLKFLRNIEELAWDRRFAAISGELLLAYPKIPGTIRMLPPRLQ